MTTQGFYAWLGRAESAHAQQDRVLTTEITRVFARHKERYGSPRIHQALVRATFISCTRGIPIDCGRPT